MALWSTAAVAAGPNNQETKHFDIPQQRADVSLVTFAEQADITLIFTFDLARDKTTNRLVGSYRPEEAIQLLLDGTGLKPTFSSDGHINIAPGEEPVAEGDEMLNEKRTGALAVLAALFAGTGAEAQSDSEAVFEEVVVVGIRQSLAESISMKRNSTEFVDALVAEDFAQFPDSNLAEALQRIPGITVDRSEGPDQSNAIGEGGTINVRGLGSEFTRTEINGMTATTPGQGRGFNFNVLPSELFASAVVRKSLTAKDNEGGLAGTVDLRTYHPFDFDERIVSLSGRGTYSDESSELTPAGTFIFSNTAANGRVGVAFGLNFDQTKPRDISVDALNWDFMRDQYRSNFDLLSPADQALIGDNQYPRGPRMIENAREQDRIAATLTVQGRPSENVTISFENIFASVDHTGIQNRQGLALLSSFVDVPADIQFQDDRLAFGTFSSGSPVSSLINYEYDIQSKVQQNVITVEWDINDQLSVSPSIGYAKSEEDFRKWDQVILISAIADTELWSEGDFTGFNTAAGAIDDPSTYTDLFAVRNRPDRDQDEELSGRIDATWEFDSSAFKSVEFGVRWSDREKVFDDFDGRATISTTMTDFTPYIVSSSFDFDGAPSRIPGRILGFDYDALRSATGTDSFAVNRLPEGSYEVTEETLALYAMANFDNGRLSGNVGVRFIDTDQVSVGVQRVNDAGGGSQVLPARFENNYSYALPSLNLRWEFSDDLVGRLSAYRSLTRPFLTDIQPARSIPNFEGGNGTAGNPELDPFTSTNADIGLEWYFADNALLSVAYFRKDLNGLIERVTEEVQVTDPVTGQELNVFLSRPVNGESAEVDGFELGIQAPFSFLSDALANAGFVFNAAFTDSEAVFSNEDDIRSSSLPGLSEESFNAILYYDDGRFSTKLAYNWRGDYLLQASGSGGQPVNRDDYGQLDWSASYGVNDNLRVFFDMLNVTDEQMRSYSDFDSRKAKSLLQAGRKYYLGLSYQF